MRLDCNHIMSMVVLMVVLFTALPVFSVTWENPPTNCESGPTTLSGTQVYVDGAKGDFVSAPGNFWDHRKLGVGTYDISVEAVNNGGLGSSLCEANPTVSVTIKQQDFDDYNAGVPPKGCTNLK